MEQQNRVRKVQIINGERRLKFVSQKQRSKHASANVYKLSKGHDDLYRESQVHHPTPVEKGASSTELTNSTFASELDRVMERNGTELFKNLYMKIWPRVRSLPELLHHAIPVSEELMQYVLDDSKSVHLATLDILFLTSVLGRDLRHELSCQLLHNTILPKMLGDVIAAATRNLGQVHVSVVEAVFRTTAYLLKYVQIDLEALRRYYGATLGHSVALVRRLAAETWSPFLRKQSPQILHTHVRRVCRALATACHQTHPSKQCDNAIRGVSLLLFYTARGMPGRLHSSKGMIMMDYLLEALRNSSSKPLEPPKLLFVKQVVQQFMSHLCEHLTSNPKNIIQPTILQVWNRLFDSLDALLVNQAQIDQSILCHLLQIICECLQPLGIHIRDPEATQRSVTAVQTLLRLYQPVLAEPAQHLTLQLVCVTYRLDEGDSLSKSLLELLAYTSTPAIYLAQNLLPQSPNDTIMLSSLVSTAATAQSDEALLLLHTIAKHYYAQQKILTEPLCIMEDESQYHNLVELCIKDRIDEQELIYVLPCIHFLSNVVSIKAKKSRTRSHKAMIKWLQSLKPSAQNIVLRGMVYQVLGRVCRDHETLIKTADSAIEFVLKHPTSRWALRGCASVLTAMSKVDPRFQNDVFDALVVNLQSRDHLTRLDTLRIFNAFPPKSFVLDHADVDYTDDLDDEGVNEGGIQSANVNTDSSFTTTKSCDLIQILLYIEETKLTFDSERSVVTRLQQLEVLARSPNLPIQYAEAASHYLFGVLAIRYAPLWPAAKLAFQACAETQPSLAWSALLEALKRVMALAAGDLINQDHDQDASESHTATQSLHVDIQAYSQSCSNLDDSTLPVKSSSDNSDTLNGGVVVNKHSCTDNVTLFELVWSFVEGIPEVTANKSRDFVPLLLSFLHFEYYASAEDSPDARELDLASHVTESSYGQIPATRAGKKLLQKKLRCILKALAAIQSPKQMIKQKLMLGIFVTLLAEADTGIAKLAFDCILHFKLAFVGPYREQLQNMMDKGSLRDALIGFDVSKEAAVVDRYHRAMLFPLLTRMLFGQLSGARGRHSKESSDSRRRCILSFLAKMSYTDGELDHFVYMMCRHFIPMNHNLAAPYLDQGLDALITMRGNKIALAKCLTVDEVDSIPVQKHVGFLTLLESAISHLGLGVKAHVDVLLSIVLTLYEYSDVKRSRMGQSDHDVNIDGKDDDINEENDGEVSLPEDEEMDGEFVSKTRLGAIRKLCYRRLSELFVRFASHVSFIEFSERLWAVLAPAIDNLPRSVIHSEMVPSLLTFLEVMSTQPSLVELLSLCPNAVLAVFKCISDTSHNKVMNTCLSIVRNLLNGGSTEYKDAGGSLGEALVRNHLGLLIDQLSFRLLKTKKGGSSATLQALDRKIFSILCRASTLIATSRISLDATNSPDLLTLEQLCDLLVLYLTLERLPKEPVLKDVLGALESFMGKVSKACAARHLIRIARLLGPHRDNPGIQSMEVRLMIVAVLKVIASNCDNDLDAIMDALEQMNTVNVEYLGEPNFEKMLPVLNQLGKTDGAGSWKSLYESSADRPEDESSSIDHAMIALPLLYHCLHSMYSTDSVIRRGSFNAVKAYIQTASDISKGGTDESKLKYTKVVEGGVMPLVRYGVRSNDDFFHVMFVQLLGECSKGFAKCTRPLLHGDLSRLICEEDPETDFFLNIAHLQMHRKSRAFTRLRRDHLSIHDSSGTLVRPFSQQTLRGILISLALRAFLNAKTATDEKYALEGVATFGSLARHLNWSQYRSCLLDLLRRLKKQPDMERFLIGAFCAALDSFHFDVDSAVISSMDCTTDETAKADSNKIEEIKPEEHAAEEGKPEDGKAEEEEEDEDKEDEENKEEIDMEQQIQISIWKGMNDVIIPRAETFLVKDGVDKKGSRIKTLRPPVALALIKLYQKLPEEVLNRKLDRLILANCTILQSKQLSAREVARGTLAKMAVSLGPSFLAPVLKALSSTLDEGYQLHVRIATVLSIIVSLSESLTEQLSLEQRKEFNNQFDINIPTIVGLALKDIFGVASEMKEAESVNKKIIKEAKGRKSYATIEYLSRILEFSPSLARDYDETDPSALYPSSIHNVVMPLLRRLRSPSLTPQDLRKIQECLTNVVLGLSVNKTVKANELFPFVHSTVASFLQGGKKLDELLEDACLSDDDSDDEGNEILVTSGGKGSAHQVGITSNNKNTGTVVAWNPTTHYAPKDVNSARINNKRQKILVDRVLDGESAPKLTGRNRHGQLQLTISSSINDPSQASAISFALSLLSSYLKRVKVAPEEDSIVRSMADPFVAILTSCISTCGNDDIMLLALRCLSTLVDWNLPSMTTWRARLCSNILQCLVSSAASLTKSEISQGCFKLLALLLDKEKSHPQAKNNRNVVEEKIESKIPLKDPEVNVLISFLSGCVADVVHHHSTFALIRAIISWRFLSPELYDLMEKILVLTVQSQQDTVRKAASESFALFLVTYPLDERRFEIHLKQMILNMKYEYQDGRLSATNLLSLVIQKLPAEVMEKNARTIFFPSVLQLVNDDSKKVREAVADTISLIFKKLDAEHLKDLYNYMGSWINSSETGVLQRAAVQLLGLLVDSRPDYIRRGKLSSEIVSMVKTVLTSAVMSQEDIKMSIDDKWEAIYFCLLCLEKISINLPQSLSDKDDVWYTIVRCMVLRHAWVQQVSTRMVSSLLASVGPNQLVQKQTFLSNPGSTFEIARNICLQISEYQEVGKDDQRPVMAVKILTWCGMAMHSSPVLCYKEETKNDDDDDDSEDPKRGSGNPLNWLFNRLSKLGKERVDIRKITVFKSFASICTALNPETWTQFLQLMLDPLHRALEEAERKPINSSSQDGHEVLSVELINDVMTFLERKAGAELFLNCLSAVKIVNREWKDSLKMNRTMQDAMNPRLAAKRKLEKREKERERKKLKIQKKRKTKW